MEELVSPKVVIELVPVTVVETVVVVLLVVMFGSEKKTFQFSEKVQFKRLK